VSAPLRLTADDMQRLAGFLRDMSEATKVHGCRLEFYGSGGVEVVTAETPGHYPVLAIAWETGVGEYIVDDRSGD
jgi:hypothetical protein